MSNQKAEMFRKRSSKELSIQADDNAQSNHQMKAIIQNLATTLLDQGRRVEALTAVAKRADLMSRELDFRLVALQKLLVASGQTVGEDVLEAEVQRLKVERFDNESAAEDAAQGLEVVEGQPASDGLTAIANIKLFASGTEQTEDEVPRIRLEVGKGELIAEVDEAIRGMHVGETKRFKVTIQNRIDEASLTLLGLRQKKAPSDNTVG